MKLQLWVEQIDDDDKKEYCGAQSKSADDKKKALERAVSDLDATIASTEESIAKLTDEMAALGAGIKALDKAVAEATEQRKEENAEFKAVMASDTAAKELLKFAKNRLNKFYAPKLYLPPAKAELSSEDRIFQSEGGSIPTAAPSGIAGTGIAVLAQVSAHSQNKEDSCDGYKKSDETSGVMAMIDLLIQDLDKEMTEAETEEKDAQSDYEAMLADSKAKRAADAKALTEKGATKADLDADLEAAKESKASKSSELAATLEYITSLHAECDWLLKNFDARRAARTGEIDSLVNAKAILSGADYSLIQTEKRAFMSRSQ